MGVEIEKYENKEIIDEIIKKGDEEMKKLMLY